MYCFFSGYFVVRKPSLNYDFLISSFHRVFFCKKDSLESEFFFISFDLSKFLYLRIPFVVLEFLLLLFYFKVFLEEFFSRIIFFLLVALAVG